MKRLALVLVAGALSLALTTRASAQTITYGPIIGRGLTPDQMIIKWGTNSSTGTSSLSYGVKGGALQVASGLETANANSSYDHVTTLSGLKLDSTYDYRIAAAQPVSHELTTCPAAGAPMDLVFYGDSRNDPLSSAGQVEHAKVVAQIVKQAPDMVFESGDLVYTGKYAGYLSEFFPVVADLVATVPFMAVPGNHDNDDPLSLDFGGASVLAANFSLLFPTPQVNPSASTPYFSFTCGNAMFIGLDSEELLASGHDQAQLAFLDGRLAAARADGSLDHVFVWFHVSPYSPATGLFAHGDNANVESEWVPRFDDPANKVTAVFTGHDHLYARMNDGSHVVYVVSGGAGAGSSNIGGKSKATTAAAVAGFGFVSLHVTGSRVVGTAYDDSGTPVDNWVTLSSNPGRDGGVSDGGAIGDGGVGDDGGSIVSSDGGVVRGDGGRAAGSVHGGGCSSSGAGPAGDGVALVLIVVALAVRVRRYT